MLVLQAQDMSNLMKHDAHLLLCRRNLQVDAAEIGGGFGLYEVPRGEAEAAPVTIFGLESNADIRLCNFLDGYHLELDVRVAHPYLHALSDGVLLVSCAA